MTRDETAGTASDDNVAGGSHHAGIMPKALRISVPDLRFRASSLFRRKDFAP
ncbi:hypothetical protein [Bosea sp. LjRoot237]|uniref:hypothetical protein n=1 Tax=Bosea sp. LjRoot237 TaxID=3342292 RepID=UPI003ECF772D